MSLQSNNNKRIAKNTLFLYFRMLLDDVGVAVCKPRQIECVGSGIFRNIKCG